MTSIIVYVYVCVCVCVYVCICVCVFPFTLRAALPPSFQPIHPQIFGGKEPSRDVTQLTGALTGLRRKLEISANSNQYFYVQEGLRIGN